jgi:signal transduction histidine kinase/CHASE2 domain-containing sensor protein
MQTSVVRGDRVGWALAIVVVSACLGVIVDWRAPGLARYTRDWLVRARGPLPVPDDIAIVAIDESSLMRFGRFPWSRMVMARTVDQLAAARPKAIAIDVLFADPTIPEDDDALAESIGRAGNVVVAAQLAESAVHGAPAEWIVPLPELQQSAAAVGHVNVHTELEGIPRQIEVSQADDSGRLIRAMAVETVRIGDGIPAGGVVNTSRSLLIGSRQIPLEASAPAVYLAPANRGANSPQVLRGGRMTIDFIGPAGSFGAHTYSLAAVVEGRIPRDRFEGKYVLIGATAASMGDRLTSPFVHMADAQADQHGAFMPGVEVLANELNTILRRRFLSAASGLEGFAGAALAALLTLLALEFAQGGRELFKQLAALGAMALFILAVCYAAYARSLVFLPLVPAMVSFAAAGMLGLLHRSLVASARLDAGIAELAASGGLLVPPPPKPAPGRLPHGLEWKARTLADLNAALIDRARFVEFALRSIDEGLLIASPAGRITFANPGAAEILDSTPEALTGQHLVHKLLPPPPAATGIATEADLLARLVKERKRIEQEVSFREPRPRRYILRMAAVASGEDGEGPVLGIVATLSDITRQHELQQTKNDVISLVSHEMRTPLTAIQGMTELLAGYDVPAERRREMHLAINSEVKRLTRMITEYLDITRLESGATAVRRSPAKVDALIERLVLLLDPLAAPKRIRLFRQYPPDLPALIADPDLLSQAIENLVSNAIKYSPPDTEVRISASADESAVFIEVVDHGYGIPESDLERVFDKFYRVPRVEDAGTPGTGLGLSLVREIAELHGGSVSLASTVGEGSHFTLRIPRREPGRE